MVTQASFDVRADEVAVICREIGVKRLELVGRAASGINFDPKRTGIEFLVEFLPGSEQPWMGEFSELTEQLAKLYDRSVEDVHLAEERIIKDPGQPGNPEYWRWIDSTRKLVYDTAP